jgi:hypothetical protein
MARARNLRLAAKYMLQCPAHADILSAGKGIGPGHKQGIALMSTTYRYTVATIEAAMIFASRKAAIQAARDAAKAGQMADVWKGIADNDGKITVNLGRIHTSFPKARA